MPKLDVTCGTQGGGDGMGWKWGMVVDAGMRAAPVRGGWISVFVVQACCKARARSTCATPHPHVCSPQNAAP